MARDSRERGVISAVSGDEITANVAMASSTVSAKSDTQSSVRQAGTTPAVDTRPRLGFSPTILQKPAGTRPEPAVSVRERRKAGRNGERGAGTRSSRNELRIEQVATDAVGRAHADQAGCKLIEIGFAENERPGFAEPCNGDRILVRTITVRRTRSGRRQTLDVDIVLYRNRNAVERTRPLADVSERPRFGKDVGLFAKRDENCRIVVGTDARKASRYNVLGLDRAGAVSVEYFGDRFGQEKTPFWCDQPWRRPRSSLCAKSGPIRNGYGTWRKCRPCLQIHQSGCAGRVLRLYSRGFSVIADDVGFAPAGGRRTDEVCTWLSPP